jgi:hypothetical protein
MSNPSRDRFYVEVQGRTIGPMPLHQLERLLRRGEVDLADSVRDDSGSWCLVSELEALFPPGAPVEQSMPQPEEAAMRRDGLEPSVPIPAAVSPVLLDTFEEKGRQRVGWVVGGCVAVVVAGVGLFFALSGDGDPGGTDVSEAGRGDAIVSADLADRNPDLKPASSGSKNTTAAKAAEKNAATDDSSRDLKSQPDDASGDPLKNLPGQDDATSGVAKNQPRPTRVPESSKTNASRPSATRPVAGTTRVPGSSKTNASRPSATRPVAGKTSAGGKSTARNPGTKAAATGAGACGLCSGNGINACPKRACKNGYVKINGSKYPCLDCLGLGRIPCRTCPNLQQKRADSVATINVGKGYSRTMQVVATRNRLVLASINSLYTRNRYIDRKLDDDETRLSEVGDLAREKALNEVKILRLKSELPGLQRSFLLAKTGLARSVQRQAVLLSDGQSNGFQFSIKKRLRDLSTFINSL